jgi:predicted metal-dependent phosphoesterase TrpH/glycosyltransferase involved in cell wall biosynthesis
MPRAYGAQLRACGLVEIQGYTRLVRICLVTPFAWSQPHDVNEHVAGIAKALRELGHAVTILAPSGRTADLIAGHRALARGEDADVIAIGAAVQVSRRSSLGVPVGVRANVRLALHNGRFDVVHGFEPGLPSISYVALRDSETLGVATFFSPERLGFPPRRALREKLLARIDALLATSEQTAAAAAERFPGDYRVISRGVDTELFRPAAKRKLVVIELHSGSLPVARAALRSLRELPGWEALLLRTKPLSTRPAIPLALRDRVRVRSGRAAAARAGALAEAAIVVPAPTGSARLRLEAVAAGVALADPPGVLDQPELAAAAVARLAEDEELRERRGREGRAAAEAQSFAAVALELDVIYRGLRNRRRERRRDAGPLADRSWILADLHMHTSWSHDCSIEVADLLDHAGAEGLGAIAVTDHNAIGGALEAAALARARDLLVIPGEEVKTDDQGEVIGLFLHEEIPRGMTFAETVAAIREQEGIVYLPHPFDRMHAIPFPATLHRHLHEIDVLEVYNARLLFEGYNDEAMRYARKYGLPAGAGSDAHVLQGVGTGALRMRSFEGPEEFMLSLRTAEVLRRPKSLAYLQSLKWVAQVKEKVR